MTQKSRALSPGAQTPPVRAAAESGGGTTAAPDPAEWNEYAGLWNAVASALDDYCREHDYPRPYFSQRNKVAAQVWRTLHPDSRLGDITERPTDE